MIADLSSATTAVAIVGIILGVLWAIWLVVFTVGVFFRLGDIRRLLEQLVDQD